MSWIVKRRPRSQTGSSGPAWAFLPYVFDGQSMAMNVIVNDSLAVDGICDRIDVLWATWAEKMTKAQIRQETITELENAQNRISTHRDAKQKGR